MIGSPLVYIIAGIVFLAALAGVYVKVHGDGVAQGKAEVQTLWDAANRKAEAQARAKEASDKKAKEKADAENKAAVDSLNASIAKLRRDADQRRTQFLPPTAPTASGADTACFDRAAYLGAYGEFIKEIRGLADEGSKAVTDLNTAKEWAIQP